MRVFVDFDSTLGESEVAWAAHFRQYDVIHRHVYPCPYEQNPSWDYWTGVCGSCFRDCLNKDEVTEAIQPAFAALTTLSFLSSFCDLSLLTSRRKEENGDATWRWLHRRGLTKILSEVLFSSNKRQVVDEAKGAFLIDDSPHVAASMVGSPTTLIVYDRSYNRHLEGLRAENWPAVAGIISASLVATASMRQEEEKWGLILQNATMAQS